MLGHGVVCVGGDLWRSLVLQFAEKLKISLKISCPPFTCGQIMLFDLAPTSQAHSPSGHPCFLPLAWLHRPGGFTSHLRLTFPYLQLPGRLTSGLIHAPSMKSKMGAVSTSSSVTIFRKKPLSFPFSELPPAVPSKNRDEGSREGPGEEPHRPGGAQSMQGANSLHQSRVKASEHPFRSPTSFP